MFWALLFITGLLYLLYSWLTMRPRNFPPGPPYIPLLGSAPFIPKTHLYLGMNEWRYRYGPVVGLLLGHQPAIAVCDPATTLEVFKREEFQGRPLTDAIKERNLNKRLGLMFNEGPGWQEQRRFTLRHLKEFGFGRINMETFTLEETEELMKELENKTVQVSGLFNMSIVNLLWSVMAGKRYKHDDPQLKKLLGNIADLFRSGNVASTNLRNLFPFLKTIAPNLVEAKGSRILKQIHTFLKDEINEHRKALDENNPKDFIDVYLTEINKQPKEQSTFSEDMLVVICFDLFMAGAESVGNSLGFALLYMVLYPEVQEKVQKEIDANLGHANSPTLQDKTRLPYVEAVIMEIQRLNSIAPLAIPHKVTRDTELNGYFIPKDTQVFLSIWCLLQDKGHWGDSLDFKPERFLDESGKIKKDEWFIPFGTGRRLCPGEVFAHNNLFLFFTSFMQKFIVTLPLGHPKPDTMPLSGFTTAPQPFEVTFTPR